MNYWKTISHISYKTFFKTGLSRKILNKKVANDKVIITYHNVLPTSLFTPFFTNNVDVAESTFEFQISSLLKKYKIQPAAEILQPGKKGIYLSFDDGMLNNIEIVEPILKKYGLTAMFGICSGLVQNNIQFIWRDQIFLMLKRLLNKKIIISDIFRLSGKVVNESNLNEIATDITEFIQSENKMNEVYEYLNGVLELNNVVLKRDLFPKLRYSPMNLPDIKYLYSNGHYIASHTHSHRKLSMLSDTVLLSELNSSRQYLKKELGICDSLVYPYGSHKEVNNKVKNFAMTAGYNSAFINITKGFEKDNMFIPRVNMGNISNQSQFFGILAGINKLLR
jgi:peptidoglycan/xylan/chitin deacetylase (PgdA/CDA1 family)